MSLDERRASVTVDAAKRRSRFLCLLAVSVLFSGCVAPGSGVGRLGLKIRTAPGDSAPQELRVVLTREYGLGGLDRFFGKPEDYGHRDLHQTAVFTDGRCRIEFPAIIYHIDFWMLPPLGALPRHPPAPVYWIQFADAPDELYVVGLERGSFRFRVFDQKSRQEKQAAEAQWELGNGRYAPEPTAEGSPVWYLEFTLRKPNPPKKASTETLPAPEGIQSAVLRF